MFFTKDTKKKILTFVDLHVITSILLLIRQSLKWWQCWYTLLCKGCFPQLYDCQWSRPFIKKLPWERNVLNSCFLNEVNCCNCLCEALMNRLLDVYWIQRFEHKGFSSCLLTKPLLVLHPNGFFYCSVLSSMNRTEVLCT